MNDVKNIKRDDNTTFHYWNDGQGVYSSRSSVVNGLYSESDDLGPFTSVKEALDAQEEDYKAYNETAIEPPLV